MAMQENFIRSIMLRQLCMLQSTSQAKLLSTKLTDRLLSPNPADAEVEKSLQGKGIAGLHYLGCYVLQKLHNKHRTSKSTGNFSIKGL